MPLIVFPPCMFSLAFHLYTSRVSIRLLRRMLQTAGISLFHGWIEDKGTSFQCFLFVCVSNSLHIASINLFASGSRRAWSTYIVSGSADAAKAMGSGIPWSTGVQSGSTTESASNATKLSAACSWLSMSLWVGFRRLVERLVGDRVRAAGGIGARLLFAAPMSSRCTGCGNAAFALRQNANCCAFRHEARNLLACAC